jgi:hypothetical protein
MRLTYAVMVSCVLWGVTACGDSDSDQTSEASGSAQSVKLARPELPRPPGSKLPQELRPPR